MPLQAVGGSTTFALLAAGIVGELNERSAQLVAIAHSNCERLIRLINDLLDIARLDAGRFAMRSERFDLALQVENWNQDRREVAEAAVWREQIIEDLKQTRFEMNARLNYNAQALELKLPAISW